MIFTCFYIIFFINKNTGSYPVPHERHLVGGVMEDNAGTGKVDHNLPARTK